MILPHWRGDDGRPLPIGSICIYPGPVSGVSSSANTNWKCADQDAPRPAPSTGTDPIDSPQAILEALGWMVCDGRSLWADKYPRLYAVLGTLYGSEKENAFNLPDLRGVFLRGVDAGAGVDPDVGKRVAPTSNAAYAGVGSRQCDALQHHTHGYQGVQGTAVAQTGSGAFLVEKDKHTTDAESPARTSDETRPRNVAVWFIIRYR